MKASGLARIGRDVEVRQAGDTVCAYVSLAVTYIKGREKHTQWIDGALWGNRATALAQYLTKGTQIVVHLSDLHIETFEKADGSTGTKLAARIDDIELTDRKDVGQAPQAAPAPRPAPPPPRPAAPPAPRPSSGFDDMDDDIPF